MKSNYKQLGPYIREVVDKNSRNKIEKLLGVSIQKCFIPSIANTIGTDMSKYKIVRENQFAYGPVTSRNGDKISVALLQESDCILSTSYTVFEIIDHNELLPEYLMMWFRRPEFDRYARFMSHGSVRELFGWEEMCNVELPIPHIDKQKEIVAEYNTIVNRIKLNEQLNQKLEETAQAIYKQWFVDFEFPDENGKPYKSSGGGMQKSEFNKNEIPIGWDYKRLDAITAKIGSGATPKGGKNSYKTKGISLVRSTNVFDYNFSYGDLACIDEKQAAKLDNVTLEENDVLLNITGVSVARCCKLPQSILPGRVNQHVAIIRLNEEFYVPNYLSCALCSSEYKAKLLGTSEGGSTRQALTKTDIEETMLLLPKREVLNRFEFIGQVIINRKAELALQSRILEDLKDVVLARISKQCKQS